MNIIDALKQLDPANDDHWTADGDPLMTAVEELVGTSEITRVDVTSAAPRFSRENLELPGDETPNADDSTADDAETSSADDEVDNEDSTIDEPEDTTQEAPEAPEAPAPKEAPVATEEVVADEKAEAREDAREEFKKVNGEVQDLESQKAELENKIAAAKKKQAELAPSMEKTAKEDQQNRMNYIRSQKEMRLKRAKKQIALSEKMGNGGVVKSPLDQSLANRPRQAPKIHPSIR